MPPAPPAVRVVGLTGGIASGKTAVADLFAAQGVPLIDTDVLAREVVAPGEPALAELQQVFGSGIVRADGQLDRRTLRERVFADSAERRQLESIVHPRIRERARLALGALQTGYALLVVPLLVEGGRYSFIERVLVVDVAPEVQRQRLIERDGISAELADSMIAAQATRAARLAAADDVIDNSAGLDQLLPRVLQLHAQYQAWAAAGRPRQLG